MSDAVTVKVTASGNPRMKLPDSPGSASRGRKANSRVAVLPSTASVIWRVASSAASARSWPRRR